MMRWTSFLLYFMLLVDSRLLECVVCSSTSTAEKEKNHTQLTSTLSSSSNASSAEIVTPVSNKASLRNSEETQQQQQQQQHVQFLKWCQTTLGIQSLVKIKMFEYVDHLDEWTYRRRTKYKSKRDTTLGQKEVVESPANHVMMKTIQVRGLAAIRDIDVGEVIISVPYHALLTVHTTIDHDPVLSQILGPAQRLKNGWALHQTGYNANVQGGKEISFSTSYYEIALLIVALLYHASLGRLSPLWFYVDVLWNAPVDHMPFLWTDEQIQKEFDFIDKEPREDVLELLKLVEGIKKDIREMYDSIMEILIANHGDIFAPSKGPRGEIDRENWMFSYSRFEWAFAMVNSRHWHLPLQELDEEWVEMKNIKEDPDPAVIEDHAVIDDMHSMPANQPTDEYISLHNEALKKENMVEYNLATSAPLAESSTVSKHSFMAPLADMINYGPPCARGQYNTEKKAFEVVATCPFREDEEITFWYSDDCEDVIIANYGFTHPMVPRCPTIEDWKYRTKAWKEYAESLERTLSETYEDLYDTLQELKDCSCEERRIQGSAPAVAKAADGRMNKIKKNQNKAPIKEKDQQKQSNDGNGPGRIRRTKRNVDDEKDDVGL